MMTGSGSWLAISSAKMHTTKRTRKPEKVGYTRGMACDGCPRVWAGGESEMPAKAGAAAPSGVDGGVAGVCAVRASMSDLPRLEVDAWIDPGVGEIGDQLQQQSEQGENIKVGKYDWIIAIEHAFEAEQSEAVEGEDRL